MKKLSNAFFAAALIVADLLFAFSASAQTALIPNEIMLEIVRAEDELRYDSEISQLFKSSDDAIRKRAALAAGRIGSAAAVQPLGELLEKDQSVEVRAVAAFALGELENTAAIAAISKVLTTAIAPSNLRARALEAAGKIAAANPKDEAAIALGKTILDVLEAEFLKPARDRETVLLGLTAVLRAKPQEAEFVIGKFLSDKDQRIRADALNALVRLRAKNDDLKNQYRALLLGDDDAIVRANAARAVGASEDREALEILLKAAANDDDSRVRVAAIRSLANLNDKRAAAPLLERAEKLFAVYRTAKSKKVTNPIEKNELLEIAATLGRVLQNSNDERATKFLDKFSDAENHQSSEATTALAKIAPLFYVEKFSSAYTSAKLGGIPLTLTQKLKFDWLAISSVSQGFAEAANLMDKNQAAFANAFLELRNLVETPSTGADGDDVSAKLSDNRSNLAIPAALRAYAAFKTDALNSDISGLLRRNLKHFDFIVRATAAELIGEQPFERKNIEALAAALREAEQKDQLNDASLAILDALNKQSEKVQANDFISQEILSNSFQFAIKSPDYLVRRRAATILKAKNSQSVYPNVEVVQFPAAAKANAFNPNRVVRANYLRALVRRNNQTRAVVTTEKGAFTIELLPEDAALTVDNFIRLAQSKYFDGTTFHRVVPNFVVQGGDPRGDGNGNPGYAIRDEINLLSYERGTVGMALSGKDTGGSQWFVTHSPQPHLDGGYTIFGRVSENDMKTIDLIARGDKILNVKIIEGNTPTKIGRKISPKTVKRRTGN